MPNPIIIDDEMERLRLDLRGVECDALDVAVFYSDASRLERAEEFIRRVAKAPSLGRYAREARELVRDMHGIGEPL